MIEVMGNPWRNDNTHNHTHHNVTKAEQPAPSLRTSSTAMIFAGLAT
ncbi:hypothetical protein KCP69_19805 [Salmonella enterica subsp. enterica]|nr:hypothetical protein KCP69_19805 [Salmonella enterica subsp. enterica]